MHADRPQIPQTSPVQQLLEVLLRILQTDLNSQRISHEPVLSPLHFCKHSLKPHLAHEAFVLSHSYAYMDWVIRHQTVLLCLLCPL